MSDGVSSEVNIQSKLMAALRVSPVEDSLTFANSNNFDHQEVVGVLKSLHSKEVIQVSQKKLESWHLTDEGVEILEKGSPEFIVYEIIRSSGELLKKLIIAQLHTEGAEESQESGKLESTFEKVGLKQPKSPNEKMFDIALSQGIKLKLFKIRKEQDDILVSVINDAFSDATRTLCKKVSAGESLPSVKDYENLKKRRLAYLSVKSSFRAEKGLHFDAPLREVKVDLTRAMIQSRSWVNAEFKPYNLQAEGARPLAGSLHPLMRVREEYREIFLELGFSEMDTSNYIESSFWNFDALFVPQNHPARDMQDTFFISDPGHSKPDAADYCDAVRNVHENGGGCGSKGYAYDWSIEESRKNVLRTHTTAVTARILYQLAQKSNSPSGKFFSIDRVFRNEEMDKTHLCEFHQIEGVVVDRNLSLVQMMTILKQFFHRIGIEKIRFKPAYNPYTEPSMEIFGYHEGHKSWMEVGNSGMFRPEMLVPMGFPKNTTAIAWGLSLERPTMIKYGLKSIHDLFGHKIDISFCKRSPIYRV
ncbi:phenylalanyl-tRNA synthetase alpha chain [Perkinsela sp. CCAP 1560/4]|nr:phenylalanyl-tRNA synthetase alpha chain [Perkinsela sp. CCAP 1560/4]|eukprot:KNH06366.1 phenylalanyl-tRNA synthetase alpha chain [Perkinsela sp. CCAP 1560/4]